MYAGVQSGVHRCKNNKDRSNSAGHKQYVIHLLHLITGSVSADIEAFYTHQLLSFNSRMSFYNAQ